VNREWVCEPRTEKEIKNTEPPKKGGSATRKSKSQKKNAAIIDDLLEW
jgi:hypothetical protein